MKSKSIFTVILLLSLLLVVFFIAGTNAQAGDEGALDGTKICLDPGHGGTDPGAINTLYGLEESDINLEVSYGLRYLLEGAGAEVVMTRTGDEYLDNSDRYTFCNAEQATILISVHTNSHTDLRWDGTMTLYGPRESPELAQTLHDVMLPYLRDTRPEQIPQADFVDYGVDRFASGVLFKSTMPAAMVEPLLMSNTYEAPLLVTNIFTGFVPEAFDYGTAVFNDEGCDNFSCRRGQIAWSIYQGTLAYFDAQPGEPPGGDMYVEAIDMSYVKRGRNYAIDTAVTIVDSEGLPVPSTTVSLQLIQLPDGDLGLQTAVTGENGVATFRTKTGAAGQYQATVIDVTKADWTYVSDLNVENSEFLTIP